MASVRRTTPICGTKENGKIAFATVTVLKYTKMEHFLTECSPTEFEKATVLFIFRTGHGRTVFGSEQSYRGTVCRLTSSKMPPTKAASMKMDEWTLPILSYAKVAARLL